MRFYSARSHANLFTLFFVILLSFVAVLIKTPTTASAADTFSFSGAVWVTVPFDSNAAVNTYGPITIKLTDVTTGSTQSVKTISRTVNQKFQVAGKAEAEFSLPYTFTINKTDQYKACVVGATDDLCTIALSSKDLSYLNTPSPGDTGPTAIVPPYILVSIKYQTDHAGIIPVTAAASTTTTKTCGDVVTGVGWIICPVITGITALNDSMWSLVSGLLNVNPISQSSSIYTAWTSIRDIANVVFVIIFLVMIFSQVSNIGITNYGIKKLFPRLILGAILVNISFVIVQIIVDLANIIGSSLYNLLAGLAPNDFLAKAWTGLPGMILAAVSGTGLLVGGVALVGGAAAAFWMLAPVALMGLLALLAAILTLIFRQAVIPILAILAPLAFVAYLLPNTESWFKKWRSMLTQMLMLYPLAAVVFGGSQLAARLIIGESPDWWNTVMGVIIMTLPLFSLPYLATKGGAIVNTVGGALNSIVNKAKAPISKTAGAYADRARVQTENQAMNRVGGFSPRRSYLQYRARTEAIGQNQQRELTRGQALHVANRAESNIDFRTALATGGGQGADMRALASAINVISDLGGKEITAARAVIDHMNLSGAEKNALARGKIVPKGNQQLNGADKSVREAAIASAVSTNTVGEIEDIIKSSGDMTASQRQTLVKTMISSGTANKALHLGGATLNEIEQGKLGDIIDEQTGRVVRQRTIEEGLNEATARAIREGKYSAEKIADNDPVGLARLAREAEREIIIPAGAPDSKEVLDAEAMIRAQQQVKNQIRTAATDDRIRGRTTNAQKNWIEHPENWDSLLEQAEIKRIEHENELL